MREFGVCQLFLDDQGKSKVVSVLKKMFNQENLKLDDVTIKVDLKKSFFINEISDYVELVEFALG